MKTEKNLDKLFELARDQKNLLALDEIQDLLNQKANIPSQYKKFNVKPRIGTFKMATALSSLIVISLSAFFIFNNPNNTQQAQVSNLINNSHQSYLSDTPQEKQETVSSPTKIILQSGRKSNYIPINNTTKFIELSASESEKLGIKIDEKERTLRLVSNFDGKPTLIKLSADWGTSFEPIKNNKVSNSQSSIMPKLITDNYGFRRVAFFNDDEYLSDDYQTNWLHYNNETDKNKIERILKSINSNLLFESLKLNEDDVEMSITINPIGRKKVKILKKSSPFMHLDSNLTFKKKSFTIKIPNAEDQEYDTIIIPRSKYFIFPFNHFIPDSTINFDFNKYFDSLNLYINKGTLKIDSILKSIQPRINKFNIDSLPKKNLNFNFQIPKFKWRYLDSLFNFEPDSFEIFDFELIFPDFDDSNDTLNDIKWKKQNERKPNKKFFQDFDLNKIYNGSKKIDINRLIPIKVPVGNNSKNESSLSFILWYEPTNNLINLLPDRIIESLEPELQGLIKTTKNCESNSFQKEGSYLEIWRSCNGAIKNMSIHPNPASSRTTLFYYLTEPRELDLSLFNLTGQKIAELRPADILEAGEYEEVLDLRNYPPGLYLIVLSSNNGEKAVQRLLIE
ncbi:MAG: T9SS type A sorting domain-containing protein [Candidatus Kapabacteria bacterium]|nr:T9SS type A sorting domain-containing protein [Candidatus Kapabacteria bacterium]